MEDEPELGSSSAVRKLSLSDLADELCPFYMSIGMTFDEYWYGDYTKLSYYRKADELRQERANHDAWLQGCYLYDALCAVSPVLHAFAKKGTKPIPYLEEPYKLVTPEAKEERPKEEVQAKVGAAKFLAFAERFNQKFPNGEHQRAPNEIKE